MNNLIQFMKAVLPSRMKGKAIMWWMSFNLVGLWWWSAITEKPLDGTITATYIAALGAFVGSKGHELYEQRQTNLQQYIEAQRAKSPS